MHRFLLTTIAICLAAAALLSITHVAHANCGHDDCPGAVEVSAVTVTHYDQVGEVDIVPVEPDTGETIEVTAYWDVLDEVMPSICDCDLVATDSVSVDVDWSDATDSWSAACTGCDATYGPIFDVDICYVGGCGTIDNSWSYELIVQIAKNNGACAHAAGVVGYLSKVEYETTSVDDGDAIRTSNCTEWYSVSPLADTAFSATDLGPFECTFTCAAADGPDMSIIYD